MIIPHQNVNFSRIIVMQNDTWPCVQRIKVVHGHQPQTLWWLHKPVQTATSEVSFGISAALWINMTFFFFSSIFFVWLRAIPTCFFFFFITDVILWSISERKKQKEREDMWTRLEHKAAMNLQELPTSPVENFFTYRFGGSTDDVTTNGMPCW